MKPPPPRLGAAPPALPPPGARQGAGSAFAQAADEAKKDDPLKLDQVVVTGSSVNASRMKQSLSTSTLDLEQIQRLVPTSTAEVLRGIPGVRAESSGGQGNANVTVRGLPISAGGARYVQFQEDGLPTLLFGDIAFGTADQFLRVDATLADMQVVRGGSASTMASNSPGGLVNFISKDGRDGGGMMGLQLGLNGGREARVDGQLGGKLSPSTFYSIGGFARVGEGDRPTDFNAAKGGQLKASLTHRFDRDTYVRATVKVLDDRTPSLMPVPTYVEGGTIHQVPGIDPRRAYFIASGSPTDPVLSKDGNMVSTNPQDGLRVRSLAFGLEGQAKFGDFTLTDRFRVAQNSGRFIAMFPADNGGASRSVTPTSFTGTLFNTSIDSLDNVFNDLKAATTLAHEGGRTTLTGGLFYGRQDVAMTWFWNQYRVPMRNTGAVDTMVGTGFDTWGGCCARNFDVAYTTIAPYAALTTDLGAVTLDLSVRRDQQKASGWARSDNPTAKTWDDTTRQNVDYKVNKTSYSFGANWQLQRELALFARVSDGAAFSADRLLYGNPLDGSVPVAINETKQVEAGAKYRSGGLSAFVTLFNARTAESNYEATTQLFTANRYRANGVELELGWRAGAFALQGGATWTDAKITAANDPALVGHKPRRQADFVYQVTPSYSVGSLEFGAAFIGTTKSWGDDANTIRMPGFSVVNAFASYAVNDRLTVGLAVNNLANTVGWTEVEGDGHAARSINGRTVKATLKYSF